jgi:hypothetical protein
LRSQPGEAVNLCYDSFGLPAAMMRGLFEYLYRADGLTLLPHIPTGITRLEQHFPVRFGAKRLLFFSYQDFLDIKHCYRYGPRNFD